MTVKTITAGSMVDALTQVKQRFGSHAVILNTRTYKQGGLFGFFGRTVVEVTAADGRQIGRKRQQAHQRARSHLVAGTVASASHTARQSNAAASAGMAGTHPVRNAVHPGANTGDLIRRTYAAALADIEGRGNQASPQPSTATMPPVATTPHPDASLPQPSVTSAAEADKLTIQPAPLPEAQRLTEEMQTVKRMVGRMMRQQSRRDEASGSAAVPDKLFDKYLGLLGQEVSEELAEQIIADVRGQLKYEQLQDEAACHDAVCKAVAQLLPVESDCGLELTPTEDGRPRVIALVGPTGVGKTTTVAKLAATFKLKQKKKVGLITLDTYRIAAVDQLKTYANIIGLPLHVVMSPAEMSDALAACADCDVVLIDTAGRSQRDHRRLDELARFIDAANPHEVHLVLSSTCTESVLFDAVERFAKIRTDRIIFTKLDEAVTFGVILNVVRKVNKRLSYITTGQEVPHQIEPGKSDRLARLLLGEGVVS